MVTNWMGLGFGMIVALIGLGAAGSGIYMFWRSPVSDSSILKYRQRWRISASIDDNALRSALRVFVQIKAWTLLFIGPGVVIGALAWLFIAWRIGHDFRLLAIAAYWPVTVSGLMAIAVLGCAGQAYGVRRMRVMDVAHPAYGDLHPRRISDYVPNKLWISIALWILNFLLLTGIAWFFVNAPLQIRFGIDRWIHLPMGRFCLLIIPALAAIFLALGFGLIQWMVERPRLKSLDGISDSGIFDALFRRESIYGVLMEQALLMFLSFGAQMTLILDNLHPRHLLLPTLILVIAMMINALSYFTFIFGLLMRRAELPSPRPKRPQVIP